jgi:uroporphyrinogen decarboxylase
MNSRERLLTTLHCQKPDRIPFLESVIDEAVALALLKKPIPIGLIGGELGTGADPVLVGSLLGGSNYDRFELVENLNLDGFGMYLFLKHGGIQKEVDGHFMVTDGSIKSRTDLKAIHLPDPDDPRIYQPFRDFITQYKSSGKGLFCFLNLGSDPVILGMGFQTFAEKVYDDPGMLNDMLELYTSWYARAVVHLCELDFDFLWFGDDLAFKTAPYVSPKVFRHLILPHYKRVVEKITKPWIFHSDGNLYPILDDLLSLGMNGLHPIEPGAMDLRDLKQRYGSHLCLVGHINVDVLSRGTPAEVAELVKLAIDIAGPGGGYIAGSSNSVPYFAKPENVRAMADAVQKYGKY